MAVVYIGAFPPQYGGVTVKNENLYRALQKEIEIKKIDLNLVKKKHLGEAFRLIFSLANKNNSFVIGVSGKKTRKNFCHLLYLLNKKGMGRSVLMVMGGTASKDIAADVSYQRYVRSFKKIYVEARGMVKELNCVGIRNVDIYPNCRFQPTGFINRREPGGRLKCVFFSRICPEKGVDVILRTASKSIGIQYDFYGEVDVKYKEEFLELIRQKKNTRYLGVFTGTDDDKYLKLSQYDILLLPSRWESEGIPGIIVEARIAGIIPIVTEHNYNNELVTDGVDGIIIKKKQDDKELLNAILSIANNDNLYRKLKSASIKRASDFFLENYDSKIIRDVTAP